MILAIDYDNTYSTFPNEFDKLREMFQKQGNQVYIVTARCKKKEPIQDNLSKFNGVVYTAGKAKASVFRADIWVDDSPVTLCADFVPGEPAAVPGKALHQGYKDKHILWNYEDGQFVSYVKNSFTPSHNTE